MSEPRTEYTYDWYWRALANPHKIGDPAADLAVHDGYPQPGFYRRRFEDKRGMGAGRGAISGFKPVAIFLINDELIALVDGHTAVPNMHWLQCCKNPVTKDAYDAAVTTGEWPDIPAEITAPEPEPDRHAIGGNAPPETDSIKDMIEAVKSKLADYAKITSDDQMARAQSLRSRLLDLAREADKKRNAEKRPHLEAGKAVDAAWQPLVKDAKAAADALAAALGDYLTAKDRAAKEDARKAEESAAKASATGKLPPDDAYTAPAPQPAQIKGGYGRAATVKAVKVVTEIADWDALWGFLKSAGIGGTVHPELRDLMMKLAQRAVDAGNDVPGVTIEERKKVA